MRARRRSANSSRSGVTKTSTTRKGSQHGIKGECEKRRPFQRRIYCVDDYSLSTKFSQCDGFLTEDTAVFLATNFAAFVKIHLTTYLFSVFRRPPLRSSVASVPRRIIPLYVHTVNDRTTSEPSPKEAIGDRRTLSSPKHPRLLRMMMMRRMPLPIIQQLGHHQTHLEDARSGSSSSNYRHIGAAAHIR